MSYIDTLAHRRVGTLAGYPLYHVIVDHRSGRERGSPEFSANARNLVLGGGSGEHPALVIHHLDQICRLYLLYAIDMHAERRFSRSPQMQDFEYELVNGLTQRS